MSPRWVRRLCLAAATWLGGAAGCAAEPEPPPPATAFLCTPEASGWAEDLLPHDTIPIDVSAWNHRPAGRHGALRARGDQLVFEDGTPARFWGTNVTAKGIFASSDEQIERHAERLARLGFNLVRLHHHDSMRWVDPTVIDRDRDDSQTLHPAGLDRVDRWIASLRARGIYVWLDLHTGRVFRPGDGIPDFEELLKGPKAGEAMGFAYLNPRVQELMASFQRAFLSHVNPYTGQSYADDPAVAFALVTNENDLTDHWGRLFRGGRFPGHQARHDEGLRRFAAEHELDADTILTSDDPTGRHLWHNELEHRFFTRMRGELAALPFRGVVATTNLWGSAKLHSLPSLTAGELIDAHAYGSPGWLGTDPREQSHFALGVTAAQLLGRPISVSEWNLGDPLQEERHTAPLYLAALASFQGWDAPILFGYINEAFQSDREARPWTSYLDPALMSLMPAAALLFREGHVAMGPTLHVVEPPAGPLLGEGRNVRRTPALRTLAEQERVAVRLPAMEALPWWTPPAVPEGAVHVTRIDRSFLPAWGVSEIAASTGEFAREWERPRFRIETARSVAAVGRIGPEPLRFAEVEMTVRTPSASVAVTSLDGAPIASSRRVLVSATARSCGQERLGPHYRTEPLDGELRVRRNGRRWRAARPGSDEGVPLSTDAEWLSLRLAEARPWVVLTAVDEDEGSDTPR